MSGEEIDRVTSLAALMRAAYPGRSMTFCVQRSAECLRDVAWAITEMHTAGRCADALALQSDEGAHQTREQRQARWQALIALAERLRGRVDEEVACG